MIIIHNGELFVQCVAKAEVTGTTDKLLHRIGYLSNFGGKEEEMMCDLYPRGDGDFDFSLNRNVGSEYCPTWQRFMNGGLVFHKHDNSWGVHT